ncbi:MAG: hypothetical protein D3924_08930 [Candidatus Electrothrix sp. AR4]|nr:hypothetical protein [Candidatus Electrothrix sp. AR4]
MRKTVVLALLFVLFGIYSVHARFITQEEARQFAQNWMHEKRGRQVNMKTGGAVFESAASDAPYYELTFPQGGWMILSADDLAYPVIAFSDTGMFTDQERPVQFDAWMKNVSEEISTAIRLKLRPLPEADAAWKRFNVRLQEFSPQQRAESAVGPLLTTKWNQGTYYNAHCPVDSHGPGGHVWAGCVATAMAQLMKYHNYPSRGSGSHAYSHSVYGTLSADFGATAYNWGAMPNSLSNHNAAVALLMYHAGVSVEMYYGYNGSGANISHYAVNALKTYFNYPDSLYHAFRSSYSAAAWLDLLRTELNKKRPVLYEGYNEAGTRGHAFVCDGYSGGDYFHFNWGWGGYADGYFYLNSLTPAGNNFSSDQGGIIGVSPGSASSSLLLFIPAIIN